jgi:hypothetical protein
LSSVDGVVVGSACAKVDNARNNNGSIVLILISFYKKIQNAKVRKKNEKRGGFTFFCN